MTHFKIDLLSFANEEESSTEPSYLVSTLSEYYDQFANINAVEEKNVLDGSSSKPRYDSFCYTYEEKYQVATHSQKTLTFKMDRNIFYHDEWITNPFINYIVVGAQLCLTDSYDKQTLFTVSNISLDFNNTNTVYSITCQDSFSYQYSRQNNGYTIGNDSSSEDYIGAKSVDWWIRKICKECKVQYTYKTLKTPIYWTGTDIKNESKVENSLLRKGYTTSENGEYFVTYPFSVSGSTANAALISAAEYVGMQLEVFEHLVLTEDQYRVLRYFWLTPAKDEDKISGLIYSPYNSIESFNLKLSGDNLSTIINVQGQTKGSEDILVSLFPDITPFFSELFNSHYWKTSKYYKGFFTQICQCQPISAKVERGSGDDYFKLTLSEEILPFYTKQSFCSNNYISFIEIEETSYYSNSGNWELYYKDETDNYIQVEKDLSNISTQGIKDKELFLRIPEARNGEITDSKVYLVFSRDYSQEDLDFAEVAETCPWLENKVMDFSYFYERGIITKSQYEQINSKLNDKLRIVNGQLMLWSNQYYTAIHNKTKILADIINQLDELGAVVENDLIEEYATKGQITTYSSFESSYNLTFYQNSGSKSPLINLADIITEYSNLYFNSQQRFLKNCYKFEEYFNALNTQYSNSKAVIKTYNFKTELSNIENYLKGDNYIITLAGNTSTNVSLTPDFNQYDENYKPLFPIFDSNNYLVDIVDGNNYKNYLVLKDELVGAAKLGNNSYYIEGQDYWDKGENDNVTENYTLSGANNSKSIIEKWMKSQNNSAEYYQRNSNTYVNVKDFFSNEPKLDVESLDTYFDPSCFGLEKADKEEMKKAYIKDFPLTSAYYYDTNKKTYNAIAYSSDLDGDSYCRYGKNTGAQVGLSVAAGVTAVWSLGLFFAFPFGTLASAICAGTSLTLAAVAEDQNNKGVLYTQGPVIKSIDNNQSRSEVEPAMAEFPSLFTSVDDLSKAKDSTDQEFLNTVVSTYGSLQTTKKEEDGTLSEKYQGLLDNIYIKDTYWEVISNNEGEVINSNDNYYILPLFTSDKTFSEASEAPDYGALKKRGWCTENFVNYIQSHKATTKDKLFLSRLRWWPIENLVIKCENKGGIKTVYEFLKLQENSQCSIVQDSFHGSNGILFAKFQCQSSAGAPIQYSSMYFLLLREVNYNPDKNITENFDFSQKFYKATSDQLVDWTKVQGLVEGLYTSQTSGSESDFVKAGTVDRFEGKEFSDLMEDQLFFNSKHQRVYTLKQAMSSESYKYSNSEYNIQLLDNNNQEHLTISLPVKLQKLTLTKDENNKTYYSIETQSSTTLTKEVYFDAKGDLQFVDSNNTLSKEENNIRYSCSLTSKKLRNSKDVQVGGLTNGQFWYNFHDESDEDLALLQQAAAVIETNLETYWNLAYSASKNCNFFLPESWQPRANQEVNHFNDKIFEIDNGKITLLHNIFPKTEITKVEGKVKSRSYQMTYYNDINDYNIEVNSLKSDGDVIDDDNEFISKTKDALKNPAIQYFFNTLASDLGENVTKHWVLTENGDKTYYSYVSGGVTWDQLPKYLGAARRYDNLSGVYPMLLQILAARYQDSPMTSYTNLLNQHDEIWEKLYKMYPNLILENQHSNSDATNSSELLYSAINYLKQTYRPIDSYNLTTIDIASLNGWKNQPLEIGSAIQLDANEWGINDEDSIYALNQYLFISNISYDLRNLGSIQLTIDSIKYEDKLIKSLAKLIR